jgi:MerR family transcriptional regulator, copper efflux regulator
MYDLDSIMTEATQYTIGQLAELAAVTPRTIRYYTTEGLLPRPDTRGQFALYGEEHLLRLRLIAQLKTSYLPLGEIKARIAHLDADQVRALLEDQRDEVAPSTSAADYLAQVRARQLAPQSARHLAERAEPYTAAERPSLSLHSPAGPAASAPAPATPAYGFAAPITAPGATSPRAEEAPAAPPQVGLLRKLMPQRPARDDGAAKEDAPPDEQRWRRIELAPGVELHLREPAVPAFRERIDRLIALARSLFKADDGT